jgi:hypothetical protein
LDQVIRNALLWVLRWLYLHAPGAQCHLNGLRLDQTTLDKINVINTSCESMGMKRAAHERNA